MLDQELETDTRGSCIVQDNRTTQRPFLFSFFFLIPLLFIRLIKKVKFTENKRKAGHYDTALSITVSCITQHPNATEKALESKL